MAYTDIIDKIISDAEADAARSVDEARRRAEAISAASEARLGRDAAAAHEKVERQAAQERAMALKMAELDERKRVLAARRSVIDAAFARALELLAAMPDGQKSAFYDRLLSGCAQAGERVFCTERDAAIMAPLAAKHGLVLGGERLSGCGGFTLEHCGVVKNCTFEVLLRARRSELETKVAALLFPAGA